MGPHTGEFGRGPRGATSPVGRRAARRPVFPHSVDVAGERLNSPTPEEGGEPAGPSGAAVPARPGFQYRQTGDAAAHAPLPPLPPARPADPAAELPSMPVAPSWSPLRAAVPLFCVAWICFALLEERVTSSPDADIAGLARLLGMGAAVVALVLLTLAVAHTQVSGLRPRPAAAGVVGLGIGQGLLASALGSGPSDLWAVGAQVFVLIGVTVPLAWVGGQFQSGVRRQRVERDASVTASWIERARRQAQKTVQSVHRHDVRSTLFVIDGAARALADDRLPADQRASFGEMLSESVERLSALVDVRSEEIQPFAVDAVARAVVQAERRDGRTVTSDLPAGLTAIGRSADVAAVLRTLIKVTAGSSATGVQIRSEIDSGVVVVRVEPSGAEHLPLLAQSWDAVWAETFKVSSTRDEATTDLYVAARLLTEQGADLWSTAGRDRFAVRLPAASTFGSEEEA